MFTINSPWCRYLKKKLSSKRKKKSFMETCKLLISKCSLLPWLNFVIWKVYIEIVLSSSNTQVKLSIFSKVVLIKTFFFSLGWKFTKIWSFLVNGYSSDCWQGKYIFFVERVCKNAYLLSKPYSQAHFFYPHCLIKGVFSPVPPYCWYFAPSQFTLPCC